MISFRQGKPEDSSNDYYVLYKRNRINIEIILNSISKTHIRIWFDQINWARSVHDLRHRSFRVVALFHGQQVVAALLRERGNAAERDSEITTHSHAKYTCTRTYLENPINLGTAMMFLYDEVKILWLLRLSHRLLRSLRTTPKRIPSGDPLEVRHRMFHRIRNTRHQITTVDTRELVAPRRATVADVSYSRDGTADVRNRATRRRDARSEGERTLVRTTRRANETWSETGGANIAARSVAWWSLHELRRR